MKRSQIILATMGVIAVIAGVFIIVSNVMMAFPTNTFDTTAHESVEYVGMSMCLTCHNDAHQSGWESFHTQVIQNPIAAPQVVLAGFNTTRDFQQINIGSATRAFTAEYNAASLNSFAQQYIMKTEDGFTMLPSRWVLTSQNPIGIGSTDWIENCAECHTEAGKHIQMETQHVSDIIPVDLDSGSSLSDFKEGEDRDWSQQMTFTTLSFSVDSELPKRQMLLLRPLLLGRFVGYPTYRRGNLT